MIIQFEAQLNRSIESRPERNFLTGATGGNRADVIVDDIGSDDILARIDSTHEIFFEALDEGDMSFIIRDIANETLDRGVNNWWQYDPVLVEEVLDWSIQECEVDLLEELIIYLEYLYDQAIPDGEEYLYNVEIINNDQHSITLSPELEADGEFLNLNIEEV
ncbi:MAG: hypothetical protein ABEN55_21155 [Bradymonadaceae bacterium]